VVRTDVLENARFVGRSEGRPSPAQMGLHRLNCRFGKHRDRVLCALTVSAARGAGRRPFLLNSNLYTIRLTQRILAASSQRPTHRAARPTAAPRLRGTNNQEIFECA